ncbi:MAG: MarR family transcriptional regulator [Candidatus Marinimicrobia bacterium]|nr:MarR family transcriptional regulator [Candidatus Neomarinimicrobiota bacterium]
MDLNQNPETSDEYLKLDNQLCFPLYATSRIITRMYQPLLEKVGLTYPQYIVMLVLWEGDSLSVKEIGERVQLNTNTLTPLLKRMQELKYINRVRSTEDERIVLVNLTKAGRDMKLKALEIPHQLIASLNYPADKAIELKRMLDDFMDRLSKAEE